MCQKKSYVKDSLCQNVGPRFKSVAHQIIKSQKTFFIYYIYVFRKDFFNTILVSNFFRRLISVFQITKIIKIGGCAKMVCFGVPKSIIKPQKKTLGGTFIALLFFNWILAILAKYCEIFVEYLQICCKILRKSPITYLNQLPKP